MAQVNKKAIVTGVRGQDGYYLTELLLKKGYMVTGVTRRRSDKTEPLSHEMKYFPHYKEVEGDICDASFIISLLQATKPDEFYNLAAQSHVGHSFKCPDTTFETNATAVLNILESIRLTSPMTKFYQASTSEMYGTVKEGIATELTPLKPFSPYGVAKTAAHNLVSVYRDSYDIWACSGILFNHESERRGHDFVTRKITSWVASNISKIETNHLDTKLLLGNINSVRDWGYAPDYVYGMWLMLQAQSPDDYVLATGETYSIKDLLNVAFNYIGVTDWTPYVKQDTPADMRPKDVTRLCGSPQKAKELLNWEPKVSFREMIGRMIDHDIAQFNKPPHTRH
jgi:GDPmannose 4,6-dehydratase